MNNVIFYLEKTANKFASNTAFIDEYGCINFKDLLSNAKKIASHLIKNKVKPNTPIAFYVPKSINALCAMFGVAYARCAYAFLDVNDPSQRLHKKLEILKANVILTDEQNYQNAKQNIKNKKIILIENMLKTDIDEILIAKTKAEFLSTDLLYINFTSGSTGSPKAIAISHANIIEFIPEFIKIFDINKKSIIANQAPFDFDVSAKDIYSAVFAAAKVIIVPRSYFSMPTKLIDLLIYHEVNTIIWAVSAVCLLSQMRGFSYKVPTKIKKVLFSGEIMPIKHLKIWQEFLPNALYANLYGPTEITCNCTYHIITQKYSDYIPIGKAFANKKVFLLDKQNKLINKVGIEGEICVGGSCVAQGYYNDFEKSSEVFVQNPLNSTHFERIYKTGDLAKYNENFELVYVCRKDFQIKHMGHRIELSEIEKSVQDINGVDRVCVIYNKNQIMLFYTGTLEKNRLTKKMKEILPNYMLASKIIQLEIMPLNKNAKIDREKLLNMEIIS
ncbi:Gramicidin S synthase 2 [Campylobacter majalis]|uniref:Gramicidin S synthase 2 n=1 Tax=Campylobacter majalis TaxID=2790656 RepID=A0ABN7KBG2_9BACT|nr:AMP-binding protein [Campylobacter majalis]CAD7289349.1 Gramicidin S synthase 2 [Campylobacter majalis]